MKKTNFINLPVANFMYLTIICFLIGCNISKSTKPCTQCPQYTENINKLKKKISNDSIAMDQLGSDYVELWKENQIFSSMLSEIENEPGGHEILKKLWDDSKEM